MTNQFPASGRAEDNINQSFYFGFEQWQAVNGYTNDNYTDVTNTGNATLSSNPAYQLFPGQLGELNNTTQRELSTNSAFNDNYNMPGGAYGSLQTDKFSLASMKETDKPTFYFDYFLDTEDSNHAWQEPFLMRDSARVYIGPFSAWTRPATVISLGLARDQQQRAG